MHNSVEKRYRLNTLSGAYDYVSSILLDVFNGTLRGTKHCIPIVYVMDELTKVYQNRIMHDSYIFNFSGSLIHGDIILPTQHQLIKSMVSKGVDVDQAKATASQIINTNEQFTHVLLRCGFKPAEARQAASELNPDYLSYKIKCKRQT